jgi:hypothetical protein
MANLPNKRFNRNNELLETTSASPWRAWILKKSEKPRLLPVIERFLVLDSRKEVPIVPLKPNCLYLVLKLAKNSEVSLDEKF